MNRIDRLQAILTTLQSKRIVTADTLAKKFEVSLRTIYRDIRSLEEGGIPIGAEAGIGYYIMEGYHLPPVMFTHEEARALLLAGKMVEKMTDPSTTRAFAEALTKIRSVLDSHKKEELEDLDAKIVVRPSMYNPSEEMPSEAILDKVKEALARSVKVTFDYFASGGSEHSTREVEPLGLCYYGNHWHLIAYCLLRQDYRDFRIDRISKFMLQTARFKPSTHLTLQQYIDKLIQDTPLQKVVIQVKKETMKYIANSKYQMGFMKETPKGGHYEVEFATDSLTYFTRWLLMMGDSAVILEPESLKTSVQEFVGVLARHHGKG
jgi:predicted DNA-binding transcriptional regulator YafY